MANQIEELTETDRFELRRLVEEHQRRTGSTVASHLLEDWDEQVGKFAKVFPIDFKRVLAELESEQSGGDTVDSMSATPAVAGSGRKEG